MSPQSTNPRSHILELWLAFLVILSVGWNYLHDAKELEGRLVSRTPPGYYGLLTSALMEGHFNLNVTPDPLLFRLANPYAGPQGAARPWDMSFYRGKFYIYYGVTPALILMLPWRLLTGTYLMETTATALFCFGGFLLSAVWLLSLRRRVFPRTSLWWTVLSLLVIGFGSPAFFLSNNPTFYAVPISAAFFCLMAATVLVDRSLRATSLDRATLWLAGASLALGLAVGARPNYVLCVGLLVLPFACLWQKFPRRGSSIRSGKLVLAALLPAALVGAWLAFYNYRRFGNPFDFGIQYAMASGDMRGSHLMELGAFWGNLRLYLFKPASIIRYYPFFFSMGRPFGVLVHLTLVAAGFLFPLTFIRRSLRGDPVWAVGGLFLFGAALANLGTLCMFVGGIGVDRYIVDFMPAALLLACAVMLAVVDTAASWPAPARWTADATMFVVALWTLASGACIGVATRVPTAFRTRLEVVADRLVYAIEKRAGSIQGPLELRVVFPQDATGRRDPIVSTGNMLGTGDVVYALYPDNGHVQFGFSHLGAGGPLGSPIAADFSVPHTLIVELGSLYPPRRHPMFDSSTDEEVTALRRRLEIGFDGRTVLRATVEVYPSTPDGVLVGENRLDANVSARSFGGEVLEWHRTGLPPMTSIAAYPGGPMRLHLRWSPSYGAIEPLISTGHHGAGDMLNVEMLAGGRVRFQHDSWNSSDVVSEPVLSDIKADHVVDIEMGSLYCNSQIDVPEARRRRLAVWVDGKPAIDMDRPFNRSTAEEIEIGYNSIGSTSSTKMFTGTIFDRSCIPARPLPPEGDDWGPVTMVAVFRSDVLGVNEPLLTTGMGDAARIIYAHYQDAQHARFGLDRAGNGGAIGPLAAIDYTRPHRVHITLGALFPPVNSSKWAGRTKASALEWHRRVEVMLDGLVVLHTEEELEAAPHRQVVVGRNDVNASNCLRRFSGQITDVGRATW